MGTEVEYSIQGISSKILFGSDEPSDEKIEQLKLGNQYARPEISAAIDNSSLPRAVVLEGTREELFLAGSKVAFCLEDVKYFGKMKTAFLQSGAYTIEKVDASENIDFEAFGLIRGEIYFSKKKVLFSCKTENIGRELLEEDLAFTLSVTPKINRFFQGFPSQGPINHRISYMPRGLAVVLDAYLPHTPQFTARSETLEGKGYEVRKLENGLGEIMQTPSDLKALFEYVTAKG